MKKYLVLLLLHLSFFADAQLTKTQLKAQIKSRLSKQVRTSDVRFFFDALTDLAASADSTAKANAATSITSATSLKEGIIPTPRYGPEVGLTESVQSLKNKSIDLSFNQVTGLTLAHVSGLSQALADKQAKITAGTTSQYLRGDFSLATFPTIPTAANYVATTGVQTAIGGNKSWTGVHSFGSTLNVTGLSTLGGISLSADMLPSTANARNIGSTGFPFANVFSGFVGRNGSFTIGTTAGNQSVTFQQGASGTNIAAFQPTTGNLHLFPQGGTPADSIYRLHVRGKAKITEIINANLPLYEDNIQANAGGLLPGDIFRDGEGILHITTSLIEAPKFLQRIKTGTDIPFNSNVWRTQSPDVGTASNTDFALNKAGNKASNMYRFEVKSGFWWSGDQNNIGFGYPRERSEIYQTNANLPRDSDVWISYHVKVEPNAGNVPVEPPNKFVFIGQMHASEDKASTGRAADGKTAAIFALRLNGWDTWNMESAYSTQDPMPNEGYTGTSHPSFTMTRGEWHHVLIRTRMSPTGGGLFYLWVDKVPIYEYPNINLGYIDATGPYFKVGIYRVRMAQDLAVQIANLEVTCATCENTESLESRRLSPLPIN